MKKYFLLLTIFWFSFAANAQNFPEAINYQAVVHHANGEVAANINNIRFLISIVANKLDGEIVYQEQHSVASNNFGIVNFEIGRGNAIGLASFPDIDWSANQHFVKIEVDINNAGYVLMGEQELLSVPYALHAKSTQQIVAPLLNNVIPKYDETTKSFNNSMISQEGNRIKFNNYYFPSEALPNDYEKVLKLDRDNQLRFVGIDEKLNASIEIRLSNDTLFLDTNGLVQTAIPLTNYHGIWAINSNKDIYNLNTSKKVIINNYLEVTDSAKIINGSLRINDYRFPSSKGTDGEALVMKNGQLSWGASKSFWDEDLSGNISNNNSGNVVITDTLVVDGKSIRINNYTLPTNKGNDGEVLTIDNSDVVWAAVKNPVDVKLRMNVGSDTLFLDSNNVVQDAILLTNSYGVWRSNSDTNIYNNSIRHSVGIGTSSPLAKLHIENGAFVLNDERSSIPDDIPLISNNGYRLGWFPSKAAFRAGYFDANDISWNKATIGTHSFSMGRGAKAPKEYSFAFGQNAEAIGKYNFAFGLNAYTDSNFTIAMGQDVSAQKGASLAIGKYTHATAPNAIAIGNNDSIQGNYSLGIGDSLYTGKTLSFIYGKNIRTQNDRAIAIGSSLSTMDAGTYNPFYDPDTHKNGIAATRSPIVAIGKNINVTSNKAIAIGSNIKIETTSYYSEATAWPDENRQNTEFIEDYTSSVALGNQITVTHNNAYAIGFNIQNSVPNCMVIGANYSNYANALMYYVYEDQTKLENQTFCGLGGDGDDGDADALVVAGGPRIELLKGNSSTPYVSFRVNKRGDIFAKKDINAGRDINAVGDIYGATINPSSDTTLKTKMLPLGEMISKLTLLTPISFDWKDRENKNDFPQNFGFKAQEVEQIFPSLVKRTNKGTLSMNYDGLIAVLWKVAQEQQTAIEKQQSQIDDLQRQINELKQLIEK